MISKDVLGTWKLEQKSDGCYLSIVPQYYFKEPLRIFIPGKDPEAEIVDALGEERREYFFNVWARSIINLWDYSVTDFSIISSEILDNKCYFLESMETLYNKVSRMISGCENSEWDIKKQKYIDIAESLGIKVDCKKDTLGYIWYRFTFQSPYKEHSDIIGDYLAEPLFFKFIGNNSQLFCKKLEMCIDETNNFSETKKIINSWMDKVLKNWIDTHKAGDQSEEIFFNDISDDFVAAYVDFRAKFRKFAYEVKNV